MITMLQNWKGNVQINGTPYDSIQVFTTLNKQLSNEVHIILYSDKKKTNMNVVDTSEEYRITVKPYMTRNATPEFDFMAKWNKDIPMPLRTMVGTIEKQTPGMVYMNLHGEGLPVIKCLRCGKSLTNPISRHYGIGPECMEKLGIMADINDVENIKERLVDVKWSGWIIKSAILNQEAVE